MTLRYWTMGLAAGAALTVTTAGPALAFFPPLPIGSDPVTVAAPPAPAPVLVPVAVTTIDPAPVIIPPAVIIPPVPPPPVVVQPQGNPVVCTCVPVKPQSVPEPTAILSALAGLAAAASARRLRRGRAPGSV